jgi:hypothetical protein
MRAVDDSSPLISVRVHACEPFSRPHEVSMTTEQRGAKGLATLVNPNFVKPGVTPHALDIRCSHWEMDGPDVGVVDWT